LTNSSIDSNRVWQQTIDPWLHNVSDFKLAKDEISELGTRGNINDASRLREKVTARVKSAFNACFKKRRMSLEKRVTGQ
jgi:hypothetical protein